MCLNTELEQMDNDADEKYCLDIFEQVVIESIVRNDGIKKSNLMDDIYTYCDDKNISVVTETFKEKEDSVILNHYSNDVHSAFNRLYNSEIVGEESDLTLYLRRNREDTNKNKNK